MVVVRLKHKFFVGWRFFRCCCWSRFIVFVYSKWAICSQLNSYCYSIFTKKSSLFLLSLRCRHLRSHSLSLCVYVCFVIHMFLWWSLFPSRGCLVSVQFTLCSLLVELISIQSMPILPMLWLVWDCECVWSICWLCYFIWYLNWLGGLHAKIWFSKFVEIEIEHVVWGSAMCVERMCVFTV